MTGTVWQTITSAAQLCVPRTKFKPDAQTLKYALLQGRLQCESGRL